MEAKKFLCRCFLAAGIVFSTALHAFHKATQTTESKMEHKAGDGHTPPDDHHEESGPPHPRYILVDPWLLPRLPRQCQENYPHPKRRQIPGAILEASGKY